MNVLYEKVNEIKLKELLTCNNLILKDGTKKELKWYKQNIINYYNLKVDKRGYRKITYEKAKWANADERQYAKPSGLQGLKKDLRKYIADDLYYDFDISNCHPNILRYIMKLNNVKIHKYLDEYCNDRDLFVEKYKMPKEDFLKFINNSECKAKELEIFHKSIYTTLLNTLKEQYKHTYKSIKKDWNKDGSFLNHIFCKYERKILDNIVSFSKNEFKITPNVLCFDGVMIEKTQFADIDINEYLAKLNEHLNKVMDYPFKVISKPMTTEWKPEFGGDDMSLQEEFKVSLNNINDLPFDEYNLSVKFIEHINNPTSKYAYIDKCFWVKNQVWEKDINEHFISKDLVKFCNKLTKITNYKKIIEWLKKLLGNFELVFSPYHTERNNQVNTFKGFKAKYISGVVEKDVEDILNHIKNVNCRGIEDRYNYLLNWFSYMLKVGKNETCPVFFGEMGAGKTTIPEYFVEWIIGSEYGLIESNISKVFGRFNSTRDNKVLILLDETTTEKGNYMVIFQQIKDAITGKRFSSEKKGITMEKQVKNINNFCFSSNYSKSVIIEDKDRRFTLSNVSNEFVGDADYFINLHKIIDNEHYANKFYSFLIDRDITNYNPRKNIFTEEARDTQLNSSSIGLFVKALNDINDETFYKFSNKNHFEITCNDLYNDYEYFYETNHLKASYKLYDKSNFGKKFKEIYGDELIEPTRTGHGGDRGYHIKKFNVHEMVLR